ncbi:8277_t:CDS:2 [Paraglomus brasilianum]|uniref:8277_t:CDS:1 n=1 Tax=Paraglomus brasilianum TaxID=144538 RepID=A0A9N8ZZ91_9GLOM|nr:8277_t:CDS:2 [Paraglomus brasilianum]
MRFDHATKEYKLVAHKNSSTVVTMTRSKQSPAAMRHDRHYQRSPLGDLRGIPKKEGAGQYNWGNVTVEAATELDEHYELMDNFPKYDLEKDAETETDRRSSKVEVVDSNRFEELRAATAEEQEVQK